MTLAIVRRAGIVTLLLAACGCAALPNRDPLNVSVAGIESLPGEGIELRLAVRVRIQNPNDTPLDYDGAALTLNVNGRKLATGVSDAVGTVPRYGESVVTIAVTAPLFALVRQGFAFMTDETPDEVRYEVKGKLEGGVFGTRRFSDAGTFNLQAPAQRAGTAP
jgi:LEA14-like dessication related protein